MNLRFPEILGLLMFLATLCSFALPQSMSGRIANTLHVVFAPVAGPVQWAVGSRAERQADAQPRVQPIVSDQTGGEVVALREENRRLRGLVETLTGQLWTLDRRQAEAGAIGRNVRDLRQVVRVIGLDAGGRDILRIASSPALEEGAAVIGRGSIIGRIERVGLANTGASVRLITDRGVKTIAAFGRFGTAADGTGNAVFTLLPLEPRVIEGIGRGEMRVENITMDDVRRAGLKELDSVVLADAGAAWPISVHGYRLGLVTLIQERQDNPGLAEVRIRPEDPAALREVGVMKKDEG